MTKIVILAAGYATRLYPLTRDRPKHLIPVGGRPILEHLIEKLAPIEPVDRLYVVTNSKFADRFRDWAAGYEPPKSGLEPHVVDDGTTDEQNRLGAIGDLAFLIEREGLDDDLVVAAGDSLFTDTLEGLVAVGQERSAPVATVYDVRDLEAVKRYSSVVTDADGRITHLEEKPPQPQTTLAGIALYFYPAATLPLVRAYLAEGGNADQPGHLVAWLYPRLPVYTWRVPGEWLDIGSHDTLREAERALSVS
jgi:glucose-1-phosphate thymidylyltransferase